MYYVIDRFGTPLLARFFNSVDEAHALACSYFACDEYLVARVADGSLVDEEGF